VYLTDCVELMCLMPNSCVEVVFADPPYRLSGGCVPVKKRPHSVCRQGRVRPFEGLWAGPRVGARALSAFR
jgi:DNA modification methylase